MNDDVVADSTVLIYLAKLNDIDLLCARFGSVLVPQTVYEEVVTRGRNAGYADALVIEAATDDCLRTIEHTGGDDRVVHRLRKDGNLGPGEVAAIALAHRRDVRCLTDDHAARTTAKSLGVDVGGRYSYYSRRFELEN